MAQQLCRRKASCIFSAHRPLLFSSARSLASSSSASASSSSSPIPSSPACLIPLIAIQSPWLSSPRSAFFLPRAGAYGFFSTAATSSAASDYPSPTPPPEFSGPDVADEAAEGADLNLADDAQAMDDPSLYNMDGNYGDAGEEEEEEGEYEEEEPAPDPEASALFSPAEED